MDISFKSGNEKFYYRACAIIVHEGKILAMHDERSPFTICPAAAFSWAKRQNKP